MANRSNAAEQVIHGLRVIKFLKALIQTDVLSPDERSALASSLENESAIIACSNSSSKTLVPCPHSSVLKFLTLPVAKLERITPRETFALEFKPPLLPTTHRHQPDLEQGHSRADRWLLETAERRNSWWVGAVASFCTGILSFSTLCGIQSIRETPMSNMLYLIPATSLMISLFSLRKAIKITSFINAALKPLEYGETTDP
jgi:hypothetical protein